MRTTICLMCFMLVFAACSSPPVSAQRQPAAAGALLTYKCGPHVFVVDAANNKIHAKGADQSDLGSLSESGGEFAGVIHPIPGNDDFVSHWVLKGADALLKGATSATVTLNNAAIDCTLN